MARLRTTIGCSTRHAASVRRGVAHPPTRHIRRRHCPPKMPEMPRISVSVSEILTIFRLDFLSKKPPAGVHVVVAFNRNVAVHPWSAGLAFSETEGLGRALATLGRGAV